jgi:pSer/pThr/pTyr-binding forkhead associated (FHA) protein
MPPVVLTTLKFLFIALLYLFIARAVRVIYLDLVGQRARGNQQRPRSRPGRGTPKAVLVTEPDVPPRTVPLGEGITIGRADDCEVTLQDTYISTHHARLFQRDGQWFVEDLGSTNGTYLDRVKVTAPSPVAVGDEIKVGKTSIQVRRS